MTLSEWDPVSKQPHFKYAAVSVTKVSENGIAAQLREVVEDTKEKLGELTGSVTSPAFPDDSVKHIDKYLGLLQSSEKEIAEAFASVGEHHRDEPDIFEICEQFERTSKIHGKALQRFVEIYGKQPDHEAARVSDSLFKGPRSGGFGLLRDLHDLYLLTTEAHLGWIILLQAAEALRDKELIAACNKLGGETDGQRSWLQTRIKQAAPQALLVSKD